MQNILNFILKNLKQRKLRSWLTIIGIVIGVFAIVSLLSLSQGLKETINSEYDKLGTKKITISSKFNAYGAQSKKGLNEKDVENIEKISLIENATGKITAISEIEKNNIKLFPQIIGFDADNFEKVLKQENLELLKGNFIKDSKKKNIIIGYSYFKEFENTFEKRLNINDKLEINNKEYTIIGILKDTGSDSKNRNIYTSLENIREMTGSLDQSVDLIFSYIKDEKQIEKAAEKIETKLKRTREEEDFVVTTPQKQNENRQEILDIVSIVIIGIASISLLVGGIGITNSMYTSVLERKKEIGVLKAIGAKNKDILKIFLLESGMIGMIGGIFGSGFGFLVSYGVKKIGAYFGYDILVSFGVNILLLAIGFSFIIGLIAGFLPAYQASKQQAVDSLREE